MCVIKGDAHGHGAVECGRALAGGIARVFIGGETVYRDSALTGATPGKLL